MDDFKKDTNALFSLSMFLYSVHSHDYVFVVLSVVMFFLAFI